MRSKTLHTWRQSFPTERILWLVGLGVAASLLGDLTLYVVLPTHTAQAGIVRADVGLMLAANRIIRIFLNGPAGMLIERIPRRRIAVPALFIGALSSLLYTIPGFWPLLIGRVMWGAAWSGIWLSASTMVLDISGHDNRGRMIGRLQMWFFTGAGVSSLAGGVLTDWLGYVPALRICSVVALGAAVMWWLLLPETRPAEVPHTAAAHESPASRPTAAIPSRAPLLTGILIFGLNWLIFMGILGATLPLLLEERIGKEILVIGLLIPLSTFTGALAASNQVFGLIASPLAGWLSDRTGNRWRLVLASLGLGVVALALIAVGTGGIVIMATMLGAVATSVLQTQVMTLVGDAAHENRRGRFLGMLNTVGDLGCASGPLLAYALLPSMGLSGIFWLATVLLALVVPWTFWITWQESRTRQVMKAEA